MPIDTILGSTATTSLLTVNGPAGVSAIETIGDQDWWRIDLVAGTTYNFRLNNAGGIGGLPDAVLRLTDSAGNQLAFNDDSGGTLNSLITYTAATSGT